MNILNPLVLLMVMEYAISVAKGRRMHIPDDIIQYSAACACLQLAFKIRRSHDR